MTDLESLDDDGGQAAPVWAVFGDLMSGLLGAFVLILAGMLVAQIDVLANLREEQEQRQEEQRLRMALEQALSGPLAAGRITLVDGRIGISGSVLFDSNSHALRPEGRELLASLVQPLAVFLRERNEILMVSGFTDDRPIHEDNLHYSDNLDLSAQRALTVTRSLIEDGLDPARVFAAAFGEQQPVADNADADGRARNRRVELAPVPRATQATGSATANQRSEQR